jgi:hypothetical protein
LAALGASPLELGQTQGFATGGGARCTRDAWRTNHTCTLQCQRQAQLPIAAHWTGVLCQSCGSWWGGGDALFDALDVLEGGSQDWGSVLDAGSGQLSLPFVSQRASGGCVAVTASQPMLDALRPVGGCELVLGLWSDPQLLAGRTFDVVLADYLVGGTCMDTTPSTCDSCSVQHPLPCMWSIDSTPIMCVTPTMQRWRASSRTSSGRFWHD